MTRKELMADDTQYCCYCGGEKARFQCCGENHFQTFAQMPADEQDEFLDNDGCAPLYTSTQPIKWVGLTEEEVEQIVDRNTHDDQGYQVWCSGKGVAEGVEAKLKEKNT